jgi:hypothetical protein
VGPSSAGCRCSGDRSDTTIVDTSAIHLLATAADPDGSISSVEFLANGTLIGALASAPYQYAWTNIPSGLYTVTAVATDNAGHQRTSDPLRITAGVPPVIRLEAESATRSPTGMTVRSDVTANGGAFLDMATQSGTVTWQIQNVPSSGSYTIAFGYKLFYGIPKNQYINVNGNRVTELTFDGASQSEWLEKTVMVPLQQGGNSIQMELSWGWMYLDYLAVPSIISGTAPPGNAAPLRFALEQNYPNPFNPTTTIRFQLPGQGHVILAVYDLLGRKVAELINGVRQSGSYAVSFDGSHVASGVYIYRLQAEGFVRSRKMIVLH